MNNSQNRDPRALRGLGQADFDYTDRTEVMSKPGLKMYVERHADASAYHGLNITNELAIRDSAIDFLRGQLDEVGAAALAFVTATRLTQMMARAGVDVPVEIKEALANLFEELEALVGG